MLTKERIIARNNIVVMGSGSKTLMLGHGFGCDQNVWQYLIPGLVDRYRLILFDYVGAGQSDLAAFSLSRYSSLEGYARDIGEICKALELQDVHFVGHSVSGTIGLLAAQADPARFASHVMVCPSPCFLNVPPDYRGGFEKADLEELIGLMDRNYIGWANYLSPLVMGYENSDKLIGQLADSFCSTDPVVAKSFARATFFSDYRHLLPQNRQPALLLQNGVDSLDSVEVGKYMEAQMPHSELRIRLTQGHCIHLTHPDLVDPQIFSWVG